MIKEKYGVFGEDNVGNCYSYPHKIFNNIEDAISYAKTQKGRIAWGYPRIYQLKKVVKYEKEKQIEYSED